jgi:stringent starvation protein B
MEYVKNNEIVLNVGFEATSGLKLGNEFIEFKARFGGVSRDIVVPIDHVVAIYARENGQGMAFPGAHRRRRPATPPRRLAARPAGAAPACAWPPPSGRPPADADACRAPPSPRPRGRPALAQAHQVAPRAGLESAALESASPPA